MNIKKEYDATIGRHFLMLEAETESAQATLNHAISTLVIMESRLQNLKKLVADAAKA